MGAIFVELWMVSLYLLMTDGSSLNQLPFPPSDTCFFIEFRIVLMTRSHIDGPLSVNREKCCTIFNFYKVLKNRFIPF